MKIMNTLSLCPRIEHLGLNVVLQLLVGVPLEMVHGAARIGFVYIAGVVAGKCGQGYSVKGETGGTALSPSLWSL